jgi:CxxC motif-containing protein (DUF1111 family)
VFIKSRRATLLLPCLIVALFVTTAMSLEQRQAILAPATSFEWAEEWEGLPGGSATNLRRFDREAFSQPVPNLSFEERSLFSLGNALFRRIWVTAPASTKSSDGLGPVFNARACQRCHLKDGRGHTPVDAEDSAVSMVLKLSVAPRTKEEEKLITSGREAIIPEPTYGSQLHDRAIPGFTAEGRMEVNYLEVMVELPGPEIAKLRTPFYKAVNLTLGPLYENTLLSPRVAPPMIGLGLLEAILEKDILANADPEDRDGNGISGKPNQVWSLEHQVVTLGRFGWKAGQPSLAEQNAAAMAGDIGISNPLHSDPWGDCTSSQIECRNAAHGTDGRLGSIEASAEIMDLILFYSRTLAVPARRHANDPDVLRGKRVFYDTGCINCHIPKFATRKDFQVDALAGQLIWPYTDLLLHDMGKGLADNRPEGQANGQEWRTPPLWGIGHTGTVNEHTQFLHDGRARNLTEAILWHGGEAQAARDRFAEMTKEDRHYLLTFLNSL